jgi:hypothetical protein
MAVRSSKAMPVQRESYKGFPFPVQDFYRAKRATGSKTFTITSKGLFYEGLGFAELGQRLVFKTWWIILPLSHPCHQNSHN